MTSPDQKKGKTSSIATRSRMYNCTACTLVKGVPAGVNVYVRATSVEAARERARAILNDVWEGTTVLRPGDFDLTDGEHVRLYLDGELMSADCDVELASWDE